MTREAGYTRAGWSNPKILIIFLLVFLCGLTLGSAVTRTLLHYRLSHPAKMGLQELQQKLHLSPEQSRIVAQELDDYAKYYQNIEEEREDVAEHGRVRILKVLTPEQRTIFTSLFKARTLPVTGSTH